MVDKIEDFNPQKLQKEIDTILSKDGKSELVQSGKEPVPNRAADNKEKGGPRATSWRILLTH